MTTLAILFPSPLGFHLFVRWPRDRVQRCSMPVHASELADVLGPFGAPLVVGLVGTRHMELVAGQILDFADLVAIPDAWLRQVPRGDLHRRAEVAARILTAHRADPLRHYYGREASGAEEGAEAGVVEPAGVVGVKDAGVDLLFGQRLDPRAPRLVLGGGRRDLGELGRARLTGGGAPGGEPSRPRSSSS